MERAHDDPEQRTSPSKSSLNVPDARIEETGHTLEQEPPAKDATADSTPRVAIYLRVASTGLDGDNAFLGLRARCKAEARACGLHITHEYRDVARGMTLERPGLNALRDAVRRGDLDIVLVARRWDLSEQEAQQTALEEELTRAGVALHVVRKGIVVPAEDTPWLAEGAAFVQDLVDRWLSVVRPHIVTPRYVAIYLRASTNNPSESDLEFVKQRHRLMALIKDSGWTPVLTIEERAEDMSPTRPGLHALRNAVRAGNIQAVAVMRLGILSPYPSELALLRDEFAEHSCPIIVADDWPRRENSQGSLLPLAAERPDRTAITPSASTSDQSAERESAAPMGNLPDIASITNVTLPPIPFLNGPLFYIFLKEAIARRGGLPLTPFPLRAAIYASSSSVDSETAARDIAEQIELGRGYARAWGKVVTLLAHDIGDDSLRERPGLDSVRAAAAREEIDIVIVSSLDRLAREPDAVEGIRTEFEALGRCIEWIIPTQG